MANEAASKFMRQAEFARRRGVSKKTVTQWKSKGLLVLSDAGLVDVEATEWKLDERPPKYRGGVTHQTTRPSKGNDPPPPPAKGNGRGDREKHRPSAPADDDDGGDSFDLDAEDLPLAEAVRRKENFLGLLRKRELEVANGEWVRVEDVAVLVEREYATVRNRLLAMPGKLAESLVGASRGDIDAAIRREVTEALDELHDPAGIGERALPDSETASGETGA